MAHLLKGNVVSQKIQAEIKSVLNTWLENKWSPPSLTVILVGEDPASQVYVGHKEKMCHSLGFKSQVIRMSAQSSQTDIINQIQELNQSKDVDAILVQLPLPAGMDSRVVLESIDPLKDADCLTETNLGKMLTGRSIVLPCTPAGVIEILKHYEIAMEGKYVAVIGRSLIVGTPLSHLLNKENATVTVFHSKSQDLKKQLKNFDIVCVAAGRPRFLKAEDFKDEAIVVDVGIHREEAGLSGDVDFQNPDKVKAYTPVPGGVGPMTIAMLMQNTLKLADRHRKHMQGEM